ncbi:uncharacterized protein E0L32_002323 [Thyridium curvatum]|uniref:Uncharacterized protein n=1 Tax=Thyridium curvatum TaxID=1093900 RepID=A0A507AJ84_9PEZI|nr:uncharacterized protein E0L32_002323 [Thyridium curvatum]TPX06827.1 hypothetical protein E0L32_002323 [Thyridium curvatum]
MDQGRKKKVLVSGPYNVFLSTCHPLLTLRSDVEVHITPGATAADLVAKTSDGALKSCVTGSWQPAADPVPRARRAHAGRRVDEVFPGCSGKLRAERLLAQPARRAQAPHGHGHVVARRGLRVRVCHEAKWVIGAVEPDVIAVDAVVRLDVAFAQLFLHQARRGVLRLPASGPNRFQWEFG